MEVFNGLFKQGHSGWLGPGPDANLIGRKLGVEFAAVSFKLNGLSAYNPCPDNG